MSDKEKPLPRPPKTPFGRQRSAPEQEGQELLADRMAAAAAEGRLDAFMSQEMPESEHARSLARMMMGMSGMMPEGIAVPAAAGPQPETEPSAQAGEVPEEVARMVRSGDVKGLMDMLRQEHLKRSPDPALAATAAPAQELPAQQPAGVPVIDRELVDALIRIAQDNNVSLDWIVLRAIRVYVEEHQRTGKL